MLQVFYELTPNIYTEMDVVRYQGWNVGTACRSGEAFTGKMPFDDPGGTFEVKGWRKVRVYETTATPTLLWSGRIRNRQVKRGDSDRPSLRTGADRWWDCDAIDQNTLLGSRVIRGTSGNRPAESAGERLTWLLGTSFTILVDNGHVTYPSDRLDPNDYTLQTAADVIADCALPGGYNFFALQVDDTDFPELFFMLPTSSDWASTIKISDDPADVDNTTVFAPNYEATLDVIDEQIAYGVAVPYNGSGTNPHVYVSDSAIGDEFAYVDKVAPQANVKTASKATVIAERHLVASSTEAERITCTIHVPADQANDLRPWHLVDYKSTWMPGFFAYRACRVTQWGIEQKAFTGGGEGYLIHLELSPVEDAIYPAWVCPLDAGITSTEGKTYPPLNGTVTDSDGNVWYSNSNHAFFPDGHQPWQGPHPNTGCHGLGFASYGTGGSPDIGGAGVASTVRFVFAGPGTATIYSNPDPTADHTIAATLFYHTSGGIVEYSTVSGTDGDDLVVVAPDLPANADSCYGWIDWSIGTPGGGSGVGFVGIEWAPD